MRTLAWFGFQARLINAQTRATNAHEKYLPTPLCPHTHARNRSTFQQVAERTALVDGFERAAAVDDARHSDLSNAKAAAEALAAARASALAAATEALDASKGEAEGLREALVRAETKAADLAKEVGGSRLRRRMRAGEKGSIEGRGDVIGR